MGEEGKRGMETISHSADLEGLDDQHRITDYKGKGRHLIEFEISDS